MSQENLEIVRQSLEAFNSKGVDGLASFWHPDIEWRAVEGAPDDVGEMHGREALRRYAQDWLGIRSTTSLSLQRSCSTGRMTGSSLCSALRAAQD